MTEYKNIAWNNKGYKVKTNNGYQHFAGVAFMGDKPIFKIDFSNGSSIECTNNHKLFDINDNEVQVDQLVPGTFVLASGGNLLVTNVTETGKVSPVFDLIEVDGGHRYYTNNILSHNCAFISESDTLIDQIVLEQMKGINPILTTGSIKWFKEPEVGKTFLVSLDPAIGLGGGDNAVISVWQLPEFEQVAEWADDKSLDRHQVRVLQQILEEIHSILKENGQNSEPEIFYTVEANNNGEAIARIIEDTGEENFKGTFISESKRRYRGFKTTSKTKRNGCSKMKRLIESGKIKIHSKVMIHELRNFVAHGASFEAEVGCKDDHVMSLFNAIRMLDEVKYYDDDIYDSLSDSIDNYDDYDEDDMPAPFII